ncbi:MAG: glycosyltransferase [Candidatus Woesearchaeota archaeon]|jgi:glycosyltransferase involved in cell wall biosynthesis
MKKNLRILFVTPTYFPILGGNTITVDRIKHKLEKKGIEIKVVLGRDLTKNVIKQYNPTIVQGFHGIKSNIYPYISYLKEKDIPYVITLTGTCVNEDIKKVNFKKILKKVLENAAAVVSFEKEPFTILKKHSIIVKQHKIIPQGKPIFKGKVSIRKQLNISQSIPLVLLVAGIRKIKDPLYAIQELSTLPVALVILGEVIEPVYYNEIQNYILKHNISNIYFAKVSHEFMGSVYEESNLIINTSNSESMSTALVEAISKNKPILASDIPGNLFLPRKYIYQKKPGELKKRVEIFLKKPFSLNIKGKDIEAEKYLALYKSL